MTPELKEIQIENLRDEIERVRTVLVDGYRVRKWFVCEKITNKTLEKLIDLVEEKNDHRLFNGSLSAEYRSDSGRFDVVILKASVATNINVPTWRERNPPPSFRREGETGISRLRRAWEKPENPT